MKALALVKLLGSKLLGKKVNMPATDEYGGGLANINLAPDKKQVPLVFNGMGTIKLPDHWQN
jgi:hypothetical protein